MKKKKKKLLIDIVASLSYYLDVGDGREGFLRVGMLGVQREQRRDSQRDSGRHGFRSDPERDPRHDDDEACGDVRVEEVVAEAAAEREDHLQASEIPCVVPMSSKKCDSGGSRNVLRKQKSAIPVE